MMYTSCNQSYNHSYNRLTKMLIQIDPWNEMEMYKPYIPGSIQRHQNQ